MVEWPNMTREDVFQTLKIEATRPSLGEDWDISEKTFSESLPFLEPSFIKTVCQKYLEDPLVEPALVKAAQAIAQNPAALRLLWHFHYLVTQNYDRYFRKAYEFPELPELGENARAFYLLLAFSGYSHNGNVHEKLGVPEEDLAGAIKDFRTSISGSFERTGSIGVAPHYSGWWQGFFNGRLYRLGRLTFLQERYNLPARFFQHQETLETAALADPAQVYNLEGLICFTPDKDKHWISKISESGLEVRGSSIAASGHAQPSTRALEKRLWKEVVKKGDAVLGIHISAGVPLAMEACKESMARALEFFPRVLSDVDFKAFTCETWFLDPTLRKFCKPNSNIVQFQKRFHLLPSPRDAEFVSIRSIFGTPALKEGIDASKLSSSLQKGAAEFKRRGGTLRHGFAIHPWQLWGEEY
jgi:hypothetical protein